MEETFNQLTNAITTLLVIIITGYLIPWIKGNIEANKLKNIYSWVEKAVWAAEQLSKFDPEFDRKQYVKDFIRERFNLSHSEAEVLIESAVRILNLYEFLGDEEYESSVQEFEEQSLNY